jgi:hypothetical protein
MAGFSHQRFLWVPLLNLFFQLCPKTGRVTCTCLSGEMYKGCYLNIDKYDIRKLVIELSTAKLCQKYNMQNDMCN